MDNNGLRLCNHLKKTSHLSIFVIIQTYPDAPIKKHFFKPGLNLNLSISKFCERKFRNFSNFAPGLK